MYKALTQILAIILILCAVFYIFERNNLKNEKNNAAMLTGTINERDRQINQLYQKIGVLERDIAHASNQLAEVKQHYQVELAQVKDPSGAHLSSNAREAQNYQQYAAGLTGLIDSPEMIQNARSRIEETQVKVIFGDFIKHSLTTAEDTRLIVNLLVDRYFLDWRMRVELMDIHLSRPERVVIIEQVEKEQKQIDEKIRARLGDDLFSTYQRLQKTGNAREFVHAFNSRLSIEKQPQLSEIQTKRIIAVISKELDEFHNHPKYIAFKKMPPSQLTKAKVDTIITLVTETFSRIGKQSRKLLKSEQKRVLNSYLEHMRDQQITSLEFTLKMIDKEKG
jgi:hypothetical protein